jgi:hypothetical protein
MVLPVSIVEGRVITEPIAIGPSAINSWGIQMVLWGNWNELRLNLSRMNWKNRDKNRGTRGGVGMKGEVGEGDFRILCLREWFMEKMVLLLVAVLMEDWVLTMDIEGTVAMDIAGTIAIIDGIVAVIEDEGRRSEVESDRSLAS